jgi:hypothetical protein
VSVFSGNVVKHCFSLCKNLILVSLQSFVAEMFNECEARFSNITH